MNFRRIFLVKCLLLLFPSVKCSVVRRIYKAVNETVVLSIAAPGSIYEAIWKREGQSLVLLKHNKVKYYMNNNQCRCKILQNGTLLIQQVVKGDSGNYTVTVYHQNGTRKVEEETVLLVQDPVPQPILNAECVNKTIFVKCEVNQKAKDEEIMIELTQPSGRKIQKNASMLVSQTRHSGTFRCVVKNRVSEKVVEKVINCSEARHASGGLQLLGSSYSQLGETGTERTKCTSAAKTGKLDLHLILIIAGGAILFVVFVICLTCCIRRKKTKRCEGDDEQRMVREVRAEKMGRAERELPPLPSAPTPRHQRAQPHPQPQQQPQPPRPRPRTQPRAPQHPKERP